MRLRTLIEYSLAVVVVVILGAFVGWYFFLNTQSKEILSKDAARGYETSTDTSETRDSEADKPSLISRVIKRFTGEGTAASPTLTNPPFGQSAGLDVRPLIETATTSVKRPHQLSQVQAKPVAGMSFVKTGSSERLRYVERATGYIYEVDPATGLVIRIDNTLSPKIYEAIIATNGRVIIRSLDGTGRISTSITTIATSSNKSATSTQMSSSTSLMKDILRLAVDPRSGDLFYLVRGTSGVVGYRSEWNGTKPKQVFTSPIAHWNPVWLSDGRIILTQGAASNVPGFAYELFASGEQEPLVRGVSGLTTLPRSHGALLFGESERGHKMFAQVSPTTTAVELPIQTIADKCVWVPDVITQSTTTGRAITRVMRNLVAYCGVPQKIPANFLDDWYRGLAHTSDALWRADANAGSAAVSYIPQSDVPIDVERPTIDSTGTYMAFINRTDQSLWIWRIEK